MLVIKAFINKMLVRIANREDPDQRQPDLGLHFCLGLFVKQLVFEILEHLPYQLIPF